MGSLVRTTILGSVACAIALLSQDKGYVSAKELFYAEPEVVPKQPGGKKPTGVTPAGKKGSGSIQRVPTAYVAPGLRYKIVQQAQSGMEIAADPDRMFRSGDRVRFDFESNVDGYLYVVQEGSSGRWSVLFPDARINGGINRIQRRQRYSVPIGKWFVFNNVPGTERIMVFLSKSPIRDLPEMVKPGSQAQTLDQSIVNELNSSLRSRELIFEKDPETSAQTVPTSSPGSSGSTYVVNNGQNGEAVVVSIALKHGQ
jgi:hypothetical protein